MPGSVEEVGLSLVVLSLVFACAALIRRWSRPLRKLFIPTAVIGGFGCRVHRARSDAALAPRVSHRSRTGQHSFRSSVVDRLNPFPLESLEAVLHGLELLLRVPLPTHDLAGNP